MNRPLTLLALSIFLALPTLHALAESPAPEPATQESKSAPDVDAEKKAAEWAASLNLNDADKEARVREVIRTHLAAVRDWHNSHDPNTVPAGINPATGGKLSALDRQIIIDSTLPKSVHDSLMAGLRADLTDEQVEAVLDKYTVGKVAFTLKGYQAIVPDLTPQEEAEIVKQLKIAREQAVDFKSMKEISGIFEIYKTKCEQYLNSKGRNWHQLFSTYVKAQKAKKKPASTQAVEAP